MGSAASVTGDGGNSAAQPRNFRQFPQKEDFVMIDIKRTGKFSPKKTEGPCPLLFGRVTGTCRGLPRPSPRKGNFIEYTIMVEDSRTVCLEDDYVMRLELPDLDWISHETREVAFTMEAHGDRRFAAELIRQSEDGKYEIKFVSDDKLLSGVAANHLSQPDAETLRDASAESLPPDPAWLYDRKIQANIEEAWPMEVRIRDAVEEIQKPRPGSTPPLRGPFVGKNAVDSEGMPAHPAPLRELCVDGFFVDTWAKYAGKVKFALTYKLGPSFPRMDDWVEHVDAGHPLYFHAALPVYAGLICLGEFQGQPEWIRASDVALAGIALYVNGERHPGIDNPPFELGGSGAYGHESCHFIPGCVSTYMVDYAWVGAAFCLAPMDGDCEVRDDIYNILAYHQLLREWARKPRERGTFGTRDITIDVNLVLSTSFLANLRQVCAGSIRVSLSEKGLRTAHERLRDIQENRIHSQAALFPKRARKLLSEFKEEPGPRPNHTGPGADTPLSQSGPLFGAPPTPSTSQRSGPPTPASPLRTGPLGAGVGSF